MHDVGPFIWWPTVAVVSRGTKFIWFRNTRNRRFIKFNFCWYETLLTEGATISPHKTWLLMTTGILGNVFSFVMGQKWQCCAKYYNLCAKVIWTMIMCVYTKLDFVINDCFYRGWYAVDETKRSFASLMNKVQTCRRDRWLKMINERNPKLSIQYLNTFNLI